MSSADSGRSAGQSSSRGLSRAGKRVALVLTLVLVPLMLAISVLGSVGHEWKQCEVVDVDTSEALRVGGGWRVNLETSDCGTVLYSTGVHADGAEEAAAQFEPGTYEFLLSLASRLAADGYIPGLSPGAEDYRPVD